MAHIHPFRAIRPDPFEASVIAALPYDVYTREEAKIQVKKAPGSFLEIDRAETWFDDSVDTYDPVVYEKAAEVLQDWISQGRFMQDETPCFYIYCQTLNGRSQTGIAACASVLDYEQQVIKKHENTLASKEEDRICHIQACMAQTGPIFLAYRAHAGLTQLQNQIMQSQPPVYDFVAEGGARQQVWVIDEPELIEVIRSCFESIDSLYIADGHHRAASAVRVGTRLMQDPDHPEADRFLCVLFPDEQLDIMAYNRIVRDLNGLDKKAFLTALKKEFQVSEVPEAADLQFFPPYRHTFGMYLDHTWYQLTADQGLIPDDTVGKLDVSIIQNRVLAPILGISDPRKDKRIRFIGGIRGRQELERLCDEEHWAVAFAMYPTSIQELFAVADEGRLMPPKSTWFEPKLLSGLFIHKI